MTDRFNSLTSDRLAEALASERPPVLVDVREAAAFEAGHVPGSLNILVYELGARRAELPPGFSAPLVVVGDHRKRAHAAATFLVLIGFGSVSVLEGGIATWAGDLDTGPPKARKAPGPELRVVPNELPDQPDPADEPETAD